MTVLSGHALSLPGSVSDAGQEALIFSAQKTPLVLQGISPVSLVLNNKPSSLIMRAPRQMKIMDKYIMSPKTPTRLYLGVVLLLLCPLAMTGCGEKLIPKPFVFDMTRINQDGSENDGSDPVKKPWACVRDNQSGLIWEVKTVESGLHGINNTYSWYDPDDKTNGGFAGKANGGVCTGSNCDTGSYIKAVNAQKLCGLADWYLPSKFELNTIVDTSVPPPGPTFAKAYFPEALAGQYWTDTTFRTRRAGAWVWRFDQGSEYVAEKSEAHNVRLTHVAPKRPAEKALAK